MTDDTRRCKKPEHWDEPQDACPLCKDDTRRAAAVKRYSYKLVETDGTGLMAWLLVPDDEGEYVKYTALQQARAEGLREIIDLIPTSWLDPLLTGPRKVIGWPPFSCQDVENLLRAIKSLVEEKVQQIEARAQEGG